ncbi:Flp pilus assembly protein CpaB [Knoellia subterranea]|uniref:Flp pilus assembly protein CpaB n=1 Tax=Knoellia subterranea KCTC 19937 TaxID=1385521 RepID=A0A0A0JQJ2_9MICO|nr:Flp pilus assembly protein CpaB [Knoellia subterranea]KGN38307.1 Flp pilus assembly protein CpaB [Knoellia subterranea KCTC 19937]
MNPRQRRGLVFMAISVLVALATFFVVTGYVSNVNSQVGSRVTVYRATKAIEPYTALSADNLEPVEVPERWVSKSSVLRMDDLQGRRVGFRLNAGSTVSGDMLIPSSSLKQDEREVAVNVNSVTGVAGRVRPGDRVDIYAVFAEVPGLPKTVKVLARDIRVVSIAGEQQVTKSDEQGVEEQSVIPVTLAVVPKVAMSLTYAANFAAEVRLVALPNDVGTNRNGEIDKFDASQLGGKAIPEGVDQ